MAIERPDEIERSYDVGSATILPSLVDVTGVASVGQAVELELDAVYFDTADLALAGGAVTLRRRTGGNDDGWHVKLPRAGDTRTELQLPLGRAVKTVPRGLLSPVRALVRDHPLAPVVRISTRRREHALRDQAGTVLALVRDDRVRAEQLLGAGRLLEWREWEVELHAGDEALLDLVEQRLLRAGAEVASCPSKLERALAGMVSPDRPKPSAKAIRRGTVAVAVREHLAEQVANLHAQDRRVRASEAGSVHKMRIAARRLRAALKTYGPLLDAGTADALGDELRWLGQALSSARDAQVLRERLRKLVSTQPADLVLGPVAVLIDDELSAAQNKGRAKAIEALEETRYFRLLDDLDALVQAPPFTAAGDAPAREVIPRLLRRDAKRLQRAIKRTRHLDRGESLDVALHEARKKAKRLRYAAESTVPVLGKPSAKLASSIKELQMVLGEHQDTVMSRTFLREHGARSHTDGLNGFTFGRLHAIEEARAEAAEHAFEKIAAGLRISKVRRRLKN